MRRDSLPNVKFRLPSEDTCNECCLLKSLLRGDRVNKNIKSFQEDDQSKSYNDSKAETVTKKNNPSYAKLHATACFINRRNMQVLQRKNNIGNRRK